MSGEKWSIYLGIAISFKYYSTYGIQWELGWSDS